MNKRNSCLLKETCVSKYTLSFICHNKNMYREYKKTYKESQKKGRNNNG